MPKWTILHSIEVKTWARQRYSIQRKLIYTAIHIHTYIHYAHYIVHTCTCTTHAHTCTHVHIHMCACMCAPTHYCLTYPLTHPLTLPPHTPNHTPTHTTTSHTHSHYHSHYHFTYPLTLPLHASTPTLQPHPPTHTHPPQPIPVPTSLTANTTIHSFAPLTRRCLQTVTPQAVKALHAQVPQVFMQFVVASNALNRLQSPHMTLPYHWEPWIRLLLIFDNDSHSRSGGGRWGRDGGGGVSWMSRSIHGGHQT